MAEMNRLVEMLDEGGYSCVIANGDTVRHFTMRGVADLYRLLLDEPRFLQGSKMADKIVGRGAAALMLAGGVTRLYTHILSQGAYDLLVRDGRMVVSYGELVPHIINRTKDGWCPIELRCRDVEDVDEIVEVIAKFIEEQGIKIR